MVVRIPVNGGPPGPTGQFHRPGGARFEPGYGTHKIIPNRNAQITVEVGPPLVPIESIHHLRQAEHLMSTGATGGEVVMGTGMIATPRTNSEWIDKYNSAEFGRNTEDLHGNVSVPMWAPSYPMPVEQVEDRGGV